MSSDETPDAAAPDIRIIAGNPSATEVAAVTAVLSGVLEELADERGRELRRVRPRGSGASAHSAFRWRRAMAPGAASRPENHQNGLSTPACSGFCSRNAESAVLTAD